MLVSVVVHARLSLALYAQFSEFRVYSVLCRAVLLCSYSVGSSGSSRWHKHETTQWHTGQTFTTRKTLEWLDLLECTICISLSGVNHPYGSRHRLSPTYRYHGAPHSRCASRCSASVRADLSASAKGVLIGPFYSVESLCATYLVNITYLHRISHRLPDIAQYWSNYRFWHYGCISRTNSFSENSANIARVIYCFKKLDSMNYIYVAGSMGLSLNTLT